jgi:hypothetical protein
MPQSKRLIRYDLVARLVGVMFFSFSELSTKKTILLYPAVLVSGHFCP